MKRSRINRQARTIKTARNWEERAEGLKGADRLTFPEVYTRLNKREYEERRDFFDENQPAHLSSLSYDEWVELGASGGRPRKWNSETERKKAKRAAQKLAQGRPLSLAERNLLGLVRKRPGAYRNNLGRAMTPAERKARWRQRLGR